MLIAYASIKSGSYTTSVFCCRQVFLYVHRLLERGIGYNPGGTGKMMAFRLDVFNIR